MRMGELVGHERPAALLQGSLRSGRVSNAYLFVGEEGIGKTALALAFARALLCESPEAPPDRGICEACGTCPACHLTALGNHPHLRVIAPDGERIKIEQMRDLRHDVALTAFGGARRAYIILAAQAMTEESANCILKTLEEPPPGVTLILVTESLSQLLPTIVSRCQLLRLRPALPAAVEALLVERHGVAPHHARFIADFSGGRAGWAVRAARRPAILEVRERLLHLLVRLPDAQSVEVFRAAEEVRALAGELGAEAEEAASPDGAPGGASSEDRMVRAQAGALLDIARSWFRDLLVLKLARTRDLINTDRRSELAALAPRYPVAGLLEALDAVVRTRRYLSRSANVSLALEALMSRLSSHRAL
ncbi:MAG: DNA polymerase III subunit delta' [Armatimonadetes bacterium]|nr:DNA polymerase III subunit delta' [Armatimonadota bacterium]